MFSESALFDPILRGVILTAISLIWVVGLVRFVGLRSFSKMTAFDFVATVAAGSLLAGAGQSSDWGSFLQSIAALAGLFAVQVATSKGRQVSEGFEAAIQNQPRLLMRNGEIFDDALAETRVARDDLIGKLREANVMDLSEVRAVVLETTGDVSVLHGERLDEVLLTGVRGPG